MMTDARKTDELVKCYEKIKHLEGQIKNFLEEERRDKLEDFSSSELLEELEERKIDIKTGEQLPQAPEVLIEELGKAFDAQNRPEFSILTEKILGILQDKDIPPQYRNYEITL